MGFEALNARGEGKPLERGYLGEQKKNNIKKRSLQS